MFTTDADFVRYAKILPVKLHPLGAGRRAGSGAQPERAPRRLTGELTARLRSETFWRNFYHLPDRQKAAVRRAWKIFKANPFDPRLGVHKIHALSAKSGKTIHALTIEGNCR